MKQPTKLAMPILFLVLCLFLFFIAGCNSIDYPSAINAIETHTDVILPEYRTYIIEDDSLDAETKNIRIQSADSLNNLIESLTEK